MEAACVNPVNPAAGDGEAAFLTPYSHVQPTGHEPYLDPARDAAITTPWFSAPGLASAACVHRDGASYLEVTIHPDPSDPRMDDIGGQLSPQLGLHLIDITLTQGDLIRMVEQQGAAYTARAG